MIGGRDIVIPTARGTEALDFAIRAVSRFWPGAVLEDAVTGESLGAYPEISFAGRREILAFRNQRSADLWDELGADPSLDGTLIHFLLSDAELTITIDASAQPDIYAFVESLRQALRQDIFSAAVRRVAA